MNPLNRKKILIALALFFVVGLLIVVIIKKRSPVVVPSSQNPSSTQNNPALAVFQPFNPYPSDDRITIATEYGSVSVHNFYPDAIDQEETSLVLFKREGYTAVYDLLTSDFWIGVTGDRFDEERVKAESRLLTLLDISQTDACRLDVMVGTLYTTDPALRRAPRRLSFCF